MIKYLSNFIINIFKYVIYNLSLFYLLNWKYSFYDKNKLKYISKNIIKSFILFFLTFNFNILIDGLYYNKWDNELIHKLGLSYACHDILSLVMYFNILKTPTKIHHFSVLILSIINLYVDYSKPNIWRGLVVYSFLSCLAFYVNLFLGCRFLINKNKYNIFSKLAFIIYLLTCIINWVLQCYIFINNYKINLLSSIIYVILIYLIIYDDIMLLKFLYNY